MYRQLAALTSPADVFLYHSSELGQYLETVWALRSPAFRNIRPSLGMQAPLIATRIPAIPAPTVWQHFIYAYMIECTRICEIFDRVLYESLNSERLGILSAASQMWVRNTEDLFYKDSLPFSIFSVKSDMRPDFSAVRKNAYYRLFGMELPQRPGSNGNGASGSDHFVKPEAYNGGFLKTFEDFLTESWIGIENVNNSSGANPTDDNAVADLARRLSDMLRDRKQNGTLTREEFFAVAMMSWFHLTVEFNSPIIVDLRARGASAEERLRKVGDKVGLLPDPKADSYFQVAEPMSRVLNAIENQQLNNPANIPPTLYAANSPLRREIEAVITHWSIITGKMLKAARVTVS